MQKRKSGAYMSSGEQIAGTVFFAVYLLVLPFAAKPLFGLAELLLGITLSGDMETLIYYYILLAVTVIIFHGFLARTSRRLLDNLDGTVKTVLAGLVALYGLNELAYRLVRMAVGTRTNLNDITISARAGGAPHMMLVIVVFLAPFVEETLFRGLVFGNLKGRSRAAAYLVSCLLFALLHVWQFAVVNRDITYFLLMVQYLVPGLVLAALFAVGLAVSLRRRSVIRRMEDFRPTVPGAAACGVLLAVSLFQERGVPIRKTLEKQHWLVQFAAAFGAVLLLVVFVYLNSDYVAIEYVYENV